VFGVWYEMDDAISACSNTKHETPNTKHTRKKAAFLTFSESFNINATSVLKRKTKMELSGAQIMMEVLKEEGVDIIFGFPGGVVIDIFDELAKTDIRRVLVRHEQGAVHAADGYARASGKTGVCLVTSGPGATNAVTGIATAYMDSIPLVVFTGQVPTRLIGNDAFQEVDIVGRQPLIIPR
jgi:2-succinyl-5-enolpyruvyl-6-hydroxy-3-cyclohexene-1-carboxylate synthase